MKFNKKNFESLKLVSFIYLIMIILLAMAVIYLFTKCEKTIHIKDDMVKSKYNDLVSRLGKPTYHEKCSANNLKSATWMSPLHNFHDFGKFGGCDYIKVMGKPSKKYHPHPAIVFLIVGKYMKVPDHLMGPLKYASETINIEQLFVPDSYAEKYQKTGQKDLALVTGSCASITISVITVKFVEDMIKQYENQYECLSLYETFRNEYDRRIDDYLCGRGITNPIPWFDIKFWGEPEIYDIGEDKCQAYQNSLRGNGNKNKNNNVRNKNNNIRKNNNFSQNNNQNQNMNHNLVNRNNNAPVSGLATVVNHFMSPRSHEPG